MVGLKCQACRPPSLPNVLSKMAYRQLVYTDISRDGMMQGVNVEATLAMAKASSIPVVASGGITNMDDIVALRKVSDQGICGAITGRAIYEGTLDIVEAQQYCDQYPHADNKQS